MVAKVFHGAVVHSISLGKLEILENGTLVVDAAGVIVAFENSAKQELSIPQDAEVHHLEPGEFLIPGFVDTHNHAPQWPMRGLGQGLHILEWLDRITFPIEARFADATYARRTYENTVSDFLRQGITTASYYGSRHAEATRILAEICLEKGQRAFVGKCNMDRNAPEYICEQSADVSLRETQDCVAHIRRLPGCAEPKHALVKPVLTPRFAICCSPELLRGLGKLMKKDKNLAMQTHFNEAQQEIDATRESILAHCTIMTDYDKERVKALQSGVAHCPIANMTVGGGFMVAPIRDFLRRGIKVGLGTDSGGGWASQMLAVIRQVSRSPNTKQIISQGEDKGLSLEEVFYLATLGGAQVMCLDDQIGNFQVGKQFDASWISTTTGLQSAMTPREPADSIRTIFEKFIMSGDDRNIAHVYVRGRRVAGSRQ
ncbi:hypothetical protein SLS60_004089 [Paraconiothyrium brasiliense]|uniref:Amidohydrolase-related domain-containing protein n=1 Tax=Paraconiothyrium brasiliense TaxID=300254 RepID=A0ABR3RQN3_9PLEO